MEQPTTEIDMRTTDQQTSDYLLVHAAMPAASAAPSSLPTASKSKGRTRLMRQRAIARCRQVGPVNGWPSPLRLMNLHAADLRELATVCVLV